MPINNTSLIALSAQETQDSLNMLHHSTNVDFQRVPLSGYAELGRKINSGKNLKLFTHSPTGMPTGLAGLYTTKFGQIAIPVIYNCVNNPFVNQSFQSIATLHPLISYCGDAISRYCLFRYQLNFYQQFEQAADICFADFKTILQTRQFSSMLTSWQSAYRSSRNQINRFFEETLNTSPKFEVHSIIVKQKKSSDFVPQFNLHTFEEYDSNQILEELSKPIIQTIWNTRSQNNVIGILSKDEIDVTGNHSKRLIFFVKKEFSDITLLTQSKLYQAIEPFFEDAPSSHIYYGTMPTMNVTTAPLFQNQHLNYYDLNQIGVTARLNTLKAHLYGTDYWMRVNGRQATVKIERQCS